MYLRACENSSTAVPYWPLLNNTLPFLLCTCPFSLTISPFTFALSSRLFRKWAERIIYRYTNVITGRATATDTGIWSGNKFRCLEEGEIIVCIYFSTVCVCVCVCTSYTVHRHICEGTATYIHNALLTTNKICLVWTLFLSYWVALFCLQYWSQNTVTLKWTCTYMY